MNKAVWFILIWMILGGILLLKEINRKKDSKDKWDNSYANPGGED